MDPFRVGYLTFDEIAKTIKGFYRREEKLMKRDWEIARWQNLHFLMPYSKKKMLRPSDIALFYWEKGQTKIPDREQVIDIIEKWNRWDERNKLN